MPGRPRTPIGSWGDIATLTVPTGIEARARFRDADGKLRLVSARARSASAAKRALKDKLETRATATATNAGGITPAMTLAELCPYWLERKTDLRPQSRDDYEQTITGTITGQIGDITVEEITPGRIARFLESVPDGVRPRARTILSQSFALAVAHDAIVDNPVRKLPKKPAPRPDVKVLAPEDLVELRRGAAQWMSGHLNDAGEHIAEPDGRSRGRAHDLLWFVDMLLATGCRTGEVAALRWCDVNLESTPPTVTVSATMVSVAGTGLARQPFTKADDIRLLSLPPYAVQTLAEASSALPDPPADEDPLFPTAEGKHRDPNTIRRQWRRARRAAGRGNTTKYDHVDFRMMRRTVATVIDAATSDSDAAAQLGHASTTMTRRHYIAAKAAAAPDLSAILERFSHSGEGNQSDGKVMDRREIA